MLSCRTAAEGPEPAGQQAESGVGDEALRSFHRVVVWPGA
jgi:hypothetical protein